MIYYGSKCSIKPLSSNSMTVVNSASRLEVVLKFLNFLLVARYFLLVVCYCLLYARYFLFVICCYFSSIVYYESIM